jgi:hypothetical protein
VAIHPSEDETLEQFWIALLFAILILLASGGIVTGIVGKIMAHLDQLPTTILIQRREDHDTLQKYMPVFSPKIY